MKAGRTVERVPTGSPAGAIEAILLAFPVALFPAALLSDIAYLNTAVIQWSNFSSWLLFGANVFTGVVAAWAIIATATGRGRGTRAWFYPGILVVLFVIGVLDSFQHSRDGWHSVGTFGLVLSILCTVLAFAAAFLAHSRIGLSGRAR
ncbi:DUF2231 domain-containing protein [Qipengyuania spongiae]|uniref:DUF2231 domain-containing protein n=1 Tax=Qipengyuania spongiae TaxID=2909673 RepID=A0ABY5SYX9_9SPHN|nr:DUF2231 domain-containing protein [Qipengyuania spongiae]UVI39535.1 hypothetical protein L1F33_00795 [Qipengyuania spongiae]